MIRLPDNVVVTVNSSVEFFFRSFYVMRGTPLPRVLDIRKNFKEPSRTQKHTVDAYENTDTSKNYILSTSSKMTDVLQSYDVHHFNTIQYLTDADKAFQAHGGLILVENVCKPLMLKHKPESKLGLGLVHRHFTLGEPEKLVKFNNISTSWTETASI